MGRENAMKVGLFGFLLLAALASDLSSNVYAAQSTTKVTPPIRTLPKSRSSMITEGECVALGGVVDLSKACAGPTGIAGGVCKRADEFGVVHSVCIKN